MYNRQELFKFTGGKAISLKPEIIDDNNIQLELEINIGDVIANEEKLKINDITISDGKKTKDKIQQKLPKEVSLFKDSFNVLIPSGKSLLIIGNKISSGITHESKTPILGDLPLLDRVFSSHYYIKDEYIQLFLIKPTILSSEEAENMFKKPPIPVESKP